jgi:hypothetical protein
MIMSNEDKIKEAYEKARGDRALAWKEMHLPKRERTLENPKQTYVYMEGVCEGLIQAAKIIGTP